MEPTLELLTLTTRKIKPIYWEGKSKPVYPKPKVDICGFYHQPPWNHAVTKSCTKPKTFHALVGLYITKFKQNKTRHAPFQDHHLCCWGCHIWLLFPLHLWPSGSSYVVCILSLHHQVSQCSQWLPSNRECACFRLSRSSRWDLTRRWLTSLPYWLSAGCRAWDTINPHP